MGLPLLNYSSITSLTCGDAPLGGTSITPESDNPDLDPSSPGCYRPRLHTRRPRRSYQDDLFQHNASSHSTRTRPDDFRKAHRSRTARLRQKHTPSHGLARPAAAETHHVKPRSPWAADADEGCALARSAIQLPGEHKQHPQRPHRQNSRSRSCGSSDRRRPPSLERQDAFRDERTAKRRREECHGTLSFTSDLERVGRMDKGEAEEIAELYRMGLLYDDEHERGEGFSLDKIVRDEPAYSLRVRPAKPGRRGESQRADFVSLSVDLAFSAFGEDEALACWLFDGSEQIVLDEIPRQREPVHDTPRLTVIYELVDNVSEMSADDFLDSVLVSEISCLEEEDEMAWAVIGGINEKDAVPPATAVVEVEDDDADPWVVLGQDGS
ncbi:hypothetical protein NEMBOFW57_001300 [Staphylotrichum longicolle]|uniref:Uncharacterized protein n=1 Tax=Staphylotrichum longicolle TaxID=669026 RepID=A0AAD4I3M5_9PEZI|nr:hypothetical protein NEMBOFW57_001300 [Staphylotrichum longicolle]